VDPPAGRSAKLAVAKLSIHTSLFSAGYNLNLTNVPDQWKTKAGPASTTRQQSGKSGGDKSGTQSDNRRYGSDPFQQRNNGKERHRGSKDNPNFSTTLMNGLRQIREKFHDITLSEIAKEAGIRGGPSGIDVSGLPARSCLNYVCMGKCTRGNCDFNHPDQIDDATAEALLKQLEPGIRRIMDTGKRPRFTVERK
jgi:hypothetical protein